MNVDKNLNFKGVKLPTHKKTKIEKQNNIYISVFILQNKLLKSKLIYYYDYYYYDYYYYYYYFY